MGLDWLAGYRPKAGSEELFWQLFGELEVSMDEARLDQWRSLGVPSYECLGAPVVGVDPEADAWLIERLAGHGVFGDAARAQVVRLKGHVALELAPESYGLPMYTHGGLYDGVDETSFRGEFLYDCEACVGPELLAAATVRKRPADGLVYGEALCDAALVWARANGCEHVIGVYDWREDDPLARIAHIVDSAGRWCRFWASRGHLLDVWV